MIYPKPSQRYENFSLNPSSPLYRGLVFAGLGGGRGSTRYVDSAGKSHGTLTGYAGAGNTPADMWRWSPYLRRWALGLDGSNDNITCRQIIRALDAVPAITFCAWIFADVLGTRNTIYHWYASDVADGVICGLRDNEYRVLITNNSSTTAASVAYTRTGVWDHLAFTLSGTTLTLYVNGATLAQGTNSNANQATDNNTIGMRAAPSTYPFDGSIADPVFYARVLSVSEIRALADPGNTDLRVGGIPLILPPARRLWAAAPVATGWKPAWAVRRQRTVGTGVI